MKKLVIILLICAVNQAAFSQKKDKVRALFDAGVEYAKNEEYEDAIVIFKLFMNRYPGSELLGSAHFNLAHCYQNKGDTVTAIRIFRQILDSDYNEQDPYGGIMEQYQLYKHRSCVNLAEIFLAKKDFIEAEKYVIDMDKSYPYQHWCGNEKASSTIFKVYMYARVFTETNRTDEAIEMLLPHIFYNGIAQNDYAVEQLMLALEKKYALDQLKEIFAKSEESLEFNYNEDNYIEGAYVELLGTRLEIDTSIIWIDRSGKYFSLTNEELYVTALCLNPAFKKYLSK